MQTAGFISDYFLLVYSAGAVEYVHYISAEG